MISSSRVFAVVCVGIVLTGADCGKKKNTGGAPPPGPPQGKQGEFDKFDQDIKYCFKEYKLGRMLTSVASWDAKNLKDMKKYRDDCNEWAERLLNSQPLKPVSTKELKDAEKKAADERNAERKRAVETLSRFICFTTAFAELLPIGYDTHMLEREQGPTGFVKTGASYELNCEEMKRAYAKYKAEKEQFDAAIAEFAIYTPKVQDYLPRAYTASEIKKFKGLGGYTPLSILQAHVWTKAERHCLSEEDRKIAAHIQNLKNGITAKSENELGYIVSDLAKNPDQFCTNVAKYIRDPSIPLGLVDTIEPYES